ncbi:reverse transcriptase domain-containing protein [Tanacetum coccineum]|uniref:Reverse transcriptase domain-containing protein n=1 Tax=Tanacetum coccineum TaxID=301880 RepID=A0ABQ5E524_9ASTR
MELRNVVHQGLRQSIGIEMATELMDKKICTFAERQTENKRKQDDNNNQAQQQPPKKQGVAIAYTVGPGESEGIMLKLYPLCNTYKFCITMASAKLQMHKLKVGHLTRDCRSPVATNNQRNPTCYECGNQGHYRSDCPKLKNQNHGNQKLEVLEHMEWCMP